MKLRAENIWVNEWLHPHQVFVFLRHYYAAHGPNTSQKHKVQPRQVGNNSHGAALEAFVPNLCHVHEFHSRLTSSDNGRLLSKFILISLETCRPKPYV